MPRERSAAVSKGSGPKFGGAKPSGPAYASMMGLHRQEQSVLEMQQSSGNQTTLDQLFGHVPGPSDGPGIAGYRNGPAAPPPTLETIPPSSSSAASARSSMLGATASGYMNGGGLGGTVSASPSAVPEPARPTPSALAARGPMLGATASGYMNGGGLDEPVYTMPPLTSMPPQSAPLAATSGTSPMSSSSLTSAADSGYMNGAAVASLSAARPLSVPPASTSVGVVSPAPGSAYDANSVAAHNTSGGGSTPPVSSAASLYTAAVAPRATPSSASSASAPAPSPVAPSSPTLSPKGFEMKPMLDGMTDFDSTLYGPNPHMGTAMNSTTFYADTPDKRAPFTRKFDEKGKMSNASDGAALSSIGAERPAAIGAKGDRHIFAMDGEGQFHTADAIKENKTRGKTAKDNGAISQERFHHSSFMGGAEVAGAGEMQVRDGEVELVSDTSGHYRPGSKQMMQTVKQLEKNNVSMEKMGVEFVGKEDGVKNMQASALELLGYENHSPETAETQMRAKHAEKNTMLGELLGKSAGKAEDANLKPSDIKPRKPAAPVSATPAPAPSAPSSEVYKHTYVTPYAYV